MKKFFSVLFASVLILVISSCSWAGYYNEGHFGLTEDDAYVIDSIADFVEFRNRINNGTDPEGLYYKLGLNLNLAGTEDIELVGTSSRPFTGHFDGNGHTIKVNTSGPILGEKELALFGTIKTESGYAIRNLNISGTLDGDPWGKTSVAGIAVRLYNASIENCSFTGEVTAKSGYNVPAYAGGIVAEMYSGKITNCTVKLAKIRAFPYYAGDGKGCPGGIAAMMAGGTVENCTVDENCIIGGVSQKGGTFDTQIGEISVGGIAAFLNRADGNLNRGSVKNNSCYAQIEAVNKNLYEAGTLRLGGIIGEIGETNISVTDNYYDGDIAGSPASTAYVGGIIGKITGTNVPTISNNYYKGTAFGIGYNTGGEASDEPGCSKVTPPEITTGSLSNGVIKKSYSKTLAVRGGVSPYTWTVSSGKLPNNLKLNASTGKISGTPTKAGKFTFTVKVTDKNNASSEKQYTVTITAPSISGTLSNGSVKKSYSAALKASGGTSPYTWTYTGSFPNGLKLDESTGKISGTPTKAGKFTFTVKVTDKNGAEASKAYTVTITQINPTISGTFGGGVLKASYNYSISASGGTAPYKWKVSKGSLPSELKLTYSGNKATISGTPSKAGTYLFTLALTDSSGGSASKAFVVVITSPAIYYSLRNGVIKASYSDYVTAYGGTAPYTWTVSKGNLPDGLKLSYSGSDATIKGTPTKAGKFTFTLTATDKNKVKTSREFTLTVTAPSISGTLKAGTVNQSYSGTLKASGGTASYTWTISKGNLPAGLTLNKSKGTITGTPKKAGKYSFTVKITDKNKATATKGYSITIEEASDTKKSTVKSSVVNVNENAKTESRLSQNNTTEGTVVYVQPVNVSNNSASGYYVTSLEVVSDDVLSQGTGRDEDLVSVRANEPVRFIIRGIVNHESEFKVYINDELIESIIVSDEGMFTLPAEFVRDDFRIHVKAGELESQELYISAIEQ